MLRNPASWIRVIGLALLVAASACSDRSPVEPSALTPGGATAPTIALQPQDQTIPSGGAVTLRVAASGTGTIRYQWYVGVSGATTAPVDGATSASYTTPALTTTTRYWARLSSDAGSVDSATATITVTGPSAPAAVAPAITTQPQNQSVDAGRSALLRVVATGSDPLGYQWYVGDSGTTSTPVDGATSATYSPALSATTMFWVRVSNAAGSADSTGATVTVNTPAPTPPAPPAPGPPGTAPTIVAGPQSQSIASGQQASLSVSVGGSAPHTYQWYQGASGSTTTPVGGATSASFTTPALTSTTSFWVRVTNAFGTADSAAAVITVAPPPPAPGGAALEDQVLVLVNQHRAAGASCGGTPYPAVPLLTMNAQLRTAARNHSLDMATNNYVSHTSQDGRTFDQRIWAAGYSGSFPLGENIAAGQLSPAAAVSAWMASPGHCRNIMSDGYRAIGIGYAFNASSDYRHYWSQSFGGS